MTAGRYRAYCCFRDELEELGVDLRGPERELLRQTAEDLLLARAGEWDVVADARQQAALALSILAAAGRLTTGRADEVWCLIADCGPTPAPERAPVSA